MKLIGGGVSYERQLAKYNKIKYSRLGDSFVTLIGSYISYINYFSEETNTDCKTMKHLAMHGIIILHTLDAWIQQEIHLIPDTVSYVFNEAGIKSRFDVSKKATNVRYESLRIFKAKAAEVAKSLWEGGSMLLHHQMAQYLIEEYVEDGKYPFLHLPEKDRKGNFPPSDKVLRDTVKLVAKDMNRPDLISGQKKPSPKVPSS